MFGYKKRAIKNKAFFTALFYAIYNFLTSHFLILFFYYVVFTAARSEVSAGFASLTQQAHIFVLIKHKRAEILLCFLVIFIIPAVFA